MADEGAGGRTAAPAPALGGSCLAAEHGWPLRPPARDLTPLNLWRASDESLGRLLGLPPGGAHLERLLALRRSFEPLQVLRDLERLKVFFIARGDPGYPDCLAQIHDPPPGLFVRGAPGRFAECLERPRVAIVGARAASSYGLDAARLLAAGLSRAGVCVISGMAMGVDSAAHRGSLMAVGGTIAVLGCGVDVVYPRINRRLYGQILENGLVVSEYPPGTEPRPWRFPARNRIIAGLCEGTLVVEARAGSGALITADFSMDEGREVWALPGSIFSDLSQGPHALIRSGAAAVAGVEDILMDLGLEAGEITEPGEQTAPGLSDDEKRVLDAAGRRPEHPDEISRASGLSGARTAAALISLELKGLLRRDATRGYSR